MGALRFLFAPELTRSFTDAVRSSAELIQRMGVRRDGPIDGAPANRRLVISANVANEEAKENRATNARTEKRPSLPRKKRLLSFVGLLVLLAGAVFIGIGIAGLLVAEPAAAQTIDRGLFADADHATREVLAFLGDIGAGRSSVLGDMLFPTVRLQATGTFAVRYGAFRTELQRCLLLEAVPWENGSGGMAAGLMEFIDLDSVIVADSGNPITTAPISLPSDTA